MDRWFSYLDALPNESCSAHFEINKAQMLFQQHEWGKALDCTLRGLEKGGLDNTYEAYDLLGRIYSCLGKIQLSEKAFVHRDKLRR